MLVVGITGGIGCGKSLVSDSFQQDFNIPTIDADIIARELTKTPRVTKLIYQNLGAEYFDNAQVLQRDKLRKAIFSDSTLRDKLENILHPLVFEEIDRELETLKTNYCIVVIPLLFETKRKYDRIDRVLVVDCRIEEQVQRVTLRDQCSEAHVNAIIAIQMNRDERLKLADDVIENHDDIEALKQKIATLHKKYTAISEPH